MLVLSHANTSYLYKFFVGRHAQRLGTRIFPNRKFLKQAGFHFWFISETVPITPTVAMFPCRLSHVQTNIREKGGDPGIFCHNWQRELNQLCVGEQNRKLCTISYQCVQFPVKRILRLLQHYHVTPQYTTVVSNQKHSLFIAQLIA